MNYDTSPTGWSIKAKNTLHFPPKHLRTRGWRGTQIINAYKYADMVNTTQRGYKSTFTGKRGSFNRYQQGRLAARGVPSYKYRTGGISDEALMAMPMPVSRKQVSLNRQVKALIASKKKEAQDVDRATAAQTTTTLACLTSQTAFATAASGTGILDMDGDECMINHVRIKGVIENTASLDLDTSSNCDAIVRNLVVWFNKPLLVASAAGTLPPITEVLIADTIHSLPVTAAANGGRFVVLSDKQWNLGMNTFQSVAVGSSTSTGTHRRYIDYTVKVNKMAKFKVPSVSGTPAGHYDSDIAPGQLDRGIIVLYTQVATGGPQVINSTLTTRLNYTG